MQWVQEEARSIVVWVTLATPQIKLVHQQMNRVVIEEICTRPPQVIYSIVIIQLAIKGLIIRTQNEKISKHRSQS